MQKTLIDCKEHGNFVNQCLLVHKKRFESFSGKYYLSLISLLGRVLKVGYNGCTFWL